MSELPPGCPNPSCPQSLDQPGPRPPVVGGGPFFRRKGSYACADERRVARFQCKDCGRHFSEQTFSPDYREKKPGLTPAVERLAGAGYSARRAARLLGVNRKTVTSRMRRWRLRSASRSGP